jgi:phosphoribosylformimino-5-aminoimidazole carboxamide ribonucleotide (ProFAR) isomerase
MNTTATEQIQAFAKHVRHGDFLARHFANLDMAAVFTPHQLKTIGELFKRVQVSGGRTDTTTWVEFRVPAGRAAERFGSYVIAALEAAQAEVDAAHGWNTVGEIRTDSSAGIYSARLIWES